jgi:hypothetical protein
MEMAVVEESFVLNTYQPLENVQYNLDFLSIMASDL